MHTIKLGLLLTYYLNIRVQAANLSDCRIEKIDSVARIKSNRNFFCPNWNALTCCSSVALFTLRCCCCHWHFDIGWQQEGQHVSVNPEGSSLGSFAEYREKLQNVGQLSSNWKCYIIVVWLLYDIRCCNYVLSEADMSQLNLPHGTESTATVVDS